MKTREQKEAKIKEVNEALGSSKGAMVVGFNRVPVEDMNNFRGEILDAGGRLRVVKKRLLKLIFKDNKIDINLDNDSESEEKFLGQFSLVTFSGELSEVAGAVFNFSKEREVKVFGGYDLIEKAAIDKDYLERVGQLPPRDILLAQVVGAFSAPLSGLMSVLKEYSKTKK